MFDLRVEFLLRFVRVDGVLDFRLVILVELYFVGLELVVDLLQRQRDYHLEQRELGGEVKLFVVVDCMLVP